ncbi:MAG: (d)CMP kinase [Clostridia bacterium]|nr:(d)CMP kinase [Clostridia bacterium]
MSLENSIAIDGPAGAGKSTVARMLASALGYRYVSSGDLYRALALEVIRRGVDPQDEAAVTQTARTSSMALEPSPSVGQRTTLNGEDVTALIRAAAVNSVVSPVSVYPEVRELLVAAQREIARESDVVMDGRDIGTVVLPEAVHKFYLTASAAERARRRRSDYIRQGAPDSYDEVLREIVERDRIDSTREASPLKAAEDAVVIDCTEIGPEEVVERMLCLLGRSRCCSMGS